MKAYIFPGQGAQFPGMGKDLYESSMQSKELFEHANDILGFRISDTMFNGSEEDLKQTNVTQPAIFLHSVIMAKALVDRFQPLMVAGHSLGEFSALTAAGCLSFADGLRIVSIRANAMQRACEKQQGGMAAILGLDDQTVESICAQVEDIVVPANYNCPGQIVISGSLSGISMACERLKTAGAKRALRLNVGGAFHSPLMAAAHMELEKAINALKFNAPLCPIYQNVTAKATKDPEEIKINVIKQLTAPVRWTQTVENMIADGATSFTEVGPGNVLQGLVKKVCREMTTESAMT